MSSGRERVDELLRAFDALNKWGKADVFYALKQGQASIAADLDRIPVLEKAIADYQRQLVTLSEELEDMRVSRDKASAEAWQWRAAAIDGPASVQKVRRALVRLMAHWRFARLETADDGVEVIEYLVPKEQVDELLAACDPVRGEGGS